MSPTRMITVSAQNFIRAYWCAKSLGTSNRCKAWLYVLPDGHAWFSLYERGVPDTAILRMEVDFDLQPDKADVEDPRVFKLKLGDPFAAPTIDAWLQMARIGGVNPVKLRQAEEARDWYASAPDQTVPG